MSHTLLLRFTPLVSIVAVLASAPTGATGTYEPWKLSLAHSAFLMSGDLHEHLGQLIAYARSVGVKPPWSK